MKRNVVETVLGAVVILGAALFLMFGYKVGGVSSPDGFTVTANFSGIGGLAAGDEVQISGVKVGSVKSVELDSVSYLARVKMTLKSDIELPTDTAALISSKSLLGGRFLALEPGADDELIESGGKIQYTQAPQNLEQLLGQFIFSASKTNSTDSASVSQASNIPDVSNISNVSTE